MKLKAKKIIPVILTLCIMVSLVTTTGINANAATINEAVACATSGDYTYRVSNGYARIMKYTGTNTELVIPSIIDGYTVKYIGYNHVLDSEPITTVPITSVIIPDTVTEICMKAFRNCTELTFVEIPNSVTTIGDCAFYGCTKLASVEIPDSVTTIGGSAFYDCPMSYVVVSKNVVNWGYFAFREARAIYVPKDANFEADAFSFDTNFSDIYYEGSEEEWANIAPSFLKNKSWINIHYNHPLDKPAGVTSIVFDDFNLDLTHTTGNQQSGEIVLPAGTYEFNIHKGDIFNVLDGKNILGYSKTINDSTTGSLTCHARYKTKTTLVATGGTYTFAFNTLTNALSVKRTGDIPEVYITSINTSYRNSVNVVLKPVSGTNLSVGSVYLPNNAYRFKINKNGTALGCSKNSGILPYSICEPVTVSAEEEAEVDLLCDGGMITFTFNHETNQISARQIIHNEAVSPTSNIHITGGDISLDLDDNNGESNIATGSITLEKGAYSFKLYNRGVAYGSNSIFYDRGTRTLNSAFMMPSVLVAKGGNYKFTFDKTTGRLAINRL